jgi:hypothetical protein
MNLEEIRSLVAKFGLPLAGDVLINPAFPNGVLISIYITRDANGRRHPSGKILAQLTEAIAAAGGTAEYLLIDEKAQQLEEGVKASLLNSFPQLVRNSYVTVSDGVAQVWIEKKQELDNIQRVRITEHVRTYAQLFKLRGASLHVMSDFTLATPTEVLRAIRKLSPASCEEVCRELEARGFAVPSLQWVNHRFDLLRKNGLVVRMQNQTYALTREALQKLGTVKNRRSPDVGRLLALARRGA